MRTLIVTAANEDFLPLLSGLVRSLHQWGPLPATALACLDLGLRPQSRAWIARHAAHVAEPGWDLPVDPQLREKEPHLRSLTARPFLPQYFPGYDAYCWIDADAWVQERFALDWYFSVAAGGSLAAVLQVDRAYRHCEGVVAWRMDRMRDCFGAAAGQRSLWDTYYNAGVFALGANAPHWKLWAGHFTQALEATKGRVCCDQTALNHMLWIERPPVHPLPAICNWTCHLALPAFDARRQRFCEPFAPSHPIGILHLTGESKNTRLDLQGDGWQRTSLRFPEPPCR